MYIFDDLKELNMQWKRWLNIKDILKLTHTYRTIEIKEPIIIDDIYIIEYCYSLAFFVKKDNWKKYIGVSLVEEDSCYILYKSSDLKNIEFCCKSDIPKNLINEMYDELIKHLDDLKNILENKKKEEFEY